MRSKATQQSVNVEALFLSEPVTEINRNTTQLAATASSRDKDDKGLGELLHGCSNLEVFVSNLISYFTLRRQC